MTADPDAEADEPTPVAPDVDRVDPRAPRFGQALTATLLAAGIALQRPALVALVAVVLNAAVVSGWRVDAWGLLWRHVGRRVASRVADEEAEPESEPASPHRFAKLLGAVGTLLATILLYGGVPLAGYVVAGLVAAAAGLAAVTGLCIGCRMYSQVAFFRRLDVV